MTFRQRKRIAALDRRAKHLRERLTTNKGGSIHYVKEELGAIDWALALIQAAEDVDVLDDLEQQAGPFRGVA